MTCIVGSVHVVCPISHHDEVERGGNVDPEEETDEMTLVVKSDAICDPWTVVCEGSVSDVRSGRD